MTPLPLPSTPMKIGMYRCILFLESIFFQSQQCSLQLSPCAIAITLQKQEKPSFRVPAAIYLFESCFESLSVLLYNLKREKCHKFPCYRQKSVEGPLKVTLYRIFFCNGNNH